MSKTLLQNNLAAYVEQHAITKIHPLILGMYNKAVKDIKASYNTPLSQLQLIYMLCKLKQPNKIIEVGFFRGLTSVTMSLASSKDTKIDLLDITKEYSQDYQYYWEKSGLNSKANLYINKASNTLEKMLETKSLTYDFGYIDANKSEYLTYYKLLLKLIKPSGIILIDNILWKGKVVNNNNPDKMTKSIQMLNNYIKEDQNVTSYLLPIEDGLYLIQKK